MTIPVASLLAFAAWTVASLLGSIGIYRWSRILTRRATVGEWRADQEQGSERYKRAMRAHANCVENLPLFGVVVLAIVATGLDMRELDILALVVVAARPIHTLVHVLPEQTEVVAALRFVFFFIQLASMIAMGVLVALNA